MKRALRRAMYVVSDICCWVDSVMVRACNALDEQS